METARTVGTVFKLNKYGTVFQVLHRFGTTPGDGKYPASALAEGWDGSLYGTTTYGGSTDSGTFFRISKDGAAYSVLRSFGTAEGDGTDPGGLIFGSDGAFYATCYYGGDMNYGALVRLFPPQTPDFLAVIFGDGYAQVTFRGASGCHYQILRSSDLKFWTSLESLVMPTTGTYTSTVLPALEGKAFYRAAWIP